MYRWVTLTLVIALGLVASVLLPAAFRPSEAVAQDQPTFVGPAARFARANPTAKVLAVYEFVADDSEVSRGISVFRAFVIAGTAGDRCRVVQRCGAPNPHTDFAECGTVVAGDTVYVHLRGNEATGRLVISRTQGQ